ncbi:MAG: hypothetical protein JWM47_1309 [Acidimicrobiales bacterium]|nr:hypothetical protein [Acidimicrobiales bacterium]
MTEADDLATQHRVWEDWARADPLWAILSEPEHKGGTWDLEAFFARGRLHVDLVLDELAQRGLEVRTGRALDFGCGVGRLTQALGAVFDRTDGVDISETMVSLAGDHNRLGDRCQYHVNRAADLALFPDATFDFVFSMIVLQHVAPATATDYIAEFGRVLAPGGIAVFDMTAELVGRSLPDHSHTAAVTIQAPASAPVGVPTKVRVEVTNTSGQDWPAGSRLAIGNHWRNADGSRELVADDGRHPLPDGLAAGASTAADLIVTVPAIGPLVLEVDLVEEGACWFVQNGSPTATAAVVGQVASRARRGRLARVLGRRAESGAADAPPDEPEPFAMNGLPREAVEAAVERSGCRVVDVVPSDAGGEHWAGFRYYTQRPA